MREVAGGQGGELSQQQPLRVEGRNLDCEFQTGEER
jgi:hypothetical protein